MVFNYPVFFSAHRRELPPTFWQMLNRCDQLQELVLGGENQVDVKFDVGPLVLGRWPKLNSLILGRTMLDFTDPSFRPTSQFKTFIQSLPSLKRLDIDSTNNINFPGPDVALESYTGLLPYGGLNPKLKSLRLFTEEGRFWGIPRIVELLNKLSLLTSLEVDTSSYVELALRGDPDDTVKKRHVEAFNSILNSCCSLVHFKYLCSSGGKQGLRMVCFFLFSFPR